MEKPNGKKLWWTPALVLTLCCTVLGAAAWMDSAMDKSFCERLAAARAVSDLRYLTVTEDIKEIKTDIKAILEKLTR